MDLIKEVYDPSKTDDPLHILCDDAFQPVTSAMMDKITSGKIQL